MHAERNGREKYMYHVLHHEVHRNANLSRSRPTQSNDTCSQPFAANHTPSTLPAAQMNTCSQICYRTAVRAARRGRLAPREQLSIPSIACHEPSAVHVPQHLNPTGLVGLPFWHPFGNPTEQAAPRPSQWEAELHRIRLHAREGRHQWQSACHLSKMGSRAPSP